MDSPESLTTEGSLREDMSIILDRESPDLPSSTSDSRDTIEVVHHDDSDMKSDAGRSGGNNSPGKNNSGSGGGSNNNNNRAAGSPNEKSAPKNPLLQERCNCEVG